jgi:RND family efflux transporter MFP subunit
MTEEGSRSQEIRAAQEQVRQAEEAYRLAKASTIQDRMSAKNAQVAVSQVQQARASLQLARVQMGYATITSPISGVVSSRMVDPGDTVSPGIPVITIEDDSRYRLEVTVPAKNVENLYIGKYVDVSVGANEQRARGTVAVISPAGDPSSHTFLVKVDIPKKAGARSGNFGRIYFPTDYSSGVVVPEAALRDQGGLPVVFLVDEQNHARMQMVKVGRRVEEGFEILSGLKPGDKVIVGNTGVLADGVKVRIEGS